jgi:hypothetical protein
LDFKDEENNYRFSGLMVTEDNLTSGFTGKLTPFAVRYNTVNVGSFTETSSYIGKYVSSSDNTYILVTNTNKDNLSITAGTTPCYTLEQYVKPSSTLVTNLLDAGDGKYSLRMLEDIENNTDNTTEANGDYSVALGKNTTASGLISTALGNNTKATRESSFAGGKESEANAKNSFAFGDNVKANAECQVVLGKYNNEDSTKAFIIANGTNSRGDSANKFTVDYNGDVKTLGSLEVKGNIVANKADSQNATDTSKYDPANNLSLGSATANCSGTLSIYGQAANTKVFEITNTGRTYIADETDYSSSTVGEGDDAVIMHSAALKVSGGVRIDKKLSVGSTTNIHGACEVHSSAESDNTGTGALVITGGAGVGKNVRVGGAIYAAKKLTVTSEGADITGTSYLKGNTEVGTSSANANLTVYGNTITIGNITTNKLGKTTLSLGVSNDTETATPATTFASGEIKVYGDYISKTAEEEEDDTAKYKHKEVFTVTDTGKTYIADTTDATATDAALKVDGGVRIAKKLNVASDTDLGAKLIVKTNPGTSESNVKVNGSLEVTGVIKASGNIDLSNTKTLTLGTKSGTNTNSAGLLTVYTTAGNDGFKVNSDGSASLYKSLEITNGDSSTSTATGAIKVSGGIGLTGNIYAGGTLNISSDANIGEKLIVKTNPSTSESNVNVDGTFSAGNSVLNSLETTGNLTTNGTFKAEAKDVAHKIGAIEFNTNSTTNTTSITGITTLTASGTINAMVFNSTSDIRKKTNIKDYRSEKSILDLPIKSFEYKDDLNHNRYIGCIAQDLQQICPELVSSDNDGFLHIQESKLVYLLLQEVKELKEKVEKLERR